MTKEHEPGWTDAEFAGIHLGDKRLEARLITLCDRFSDAPESPINQACADWAETKAAYRFFQNENVAVHAILAAHRAKTVERAAKHETVLALQDTSYFVYTSHPKTRGLSRMSMKKGKNVKRIYSNGLMMHTCLAVTTAGLPLGLLDQKIFSRRLHPKKAQAAKYAKPHDHLPVEAKESYRWLEALANTKKAMDAVRFGSFRLNPPRNNPKHRQEHLPDIGMNAIYVTELDPPAGEEPVEWMLLTNLPVTSFEEAYEKVRWYCLRWRIEMYFKVLKSGFRVEDCRLEHADRLKRYLTVMSIVAWRLFMITLVARTEPTTPCATLLADHEWKVLFLKATNNRSLPKHPPCMGDVVVWIAKLGGYLARKSDGPPGTLTLWRGWKRLADLTEGWKLATEL